MCPSLWMFWPIYVQMKANTAADKILLYLALSIKKGIDFLKFHPKLINFFLYQFNLLKRQICTKQ